MSTLVWSVVTTVQGRVPVASEVSCQESLDHCLVSTACDLDYVLTPIKLKDFWHILVVSFGESHPPPLFGLKSVSMKLLSNCVLLQGLSLVVSSYNGEDILVSFGGYNGHYNSEVKGCHDVDFGSPVLLCYLSYFVCFCVRFTFLTQATNQPCNQR